MTDCKGKSRAECLADNECVWVNAQRRTPYCRKKKGTGAGVARRLEDMTLRELRQHEYYKEIQGRSRMNKDQLVDALNKIIRSRRRRVVRRGAWDKKCKELEEKCPMSTTLLGDEWCTVDPKNVIYTKNYQMCFEYSELLKIIHEGFVALDTSYEIPQLRLKLPRDPVRQFIPKAVIKKLLLNPDVFDENQDYLIQNHDMFYFLIYLDDFYKTFDKPQYTSVDVNPVQLSKDLEKWFLKYKKPAGGLKLRRPDGGQTVEWEFRRPNLTSYTLDRNGKLNVYN